MVTGYAQNSTVLAVEMPVMNLNKNNWDVLAEQFQEETSSDRRKAIFEELWMNMKGYIRFLLKGIYGTKFLMNADDMEQEAAVSILDGLDRFDSSKSSLSTYIKPLILSQTFAYSAGMDGFHTDQYKTFLKIKKELGKMGKSASEMTDADRQFLAEKTGCQVQTLVNYLKWIDQERITYEDAEEDLVWEHSSPEMEFLEKERKEAINKCVGDLPEDQKKIITMYYGLDGMDGCKCSDIAENMGISNELVRKKMSRAKDNLYRSIGTYMNMEGKTMYREKRRINCKSKGDHSILGAAIMLVVAVLVGMLVMGIIRKTGPESKEAFTKRTENVMHSDGNRITAFPEED